MYPSEPAQLGREAALTILSRNWQPVFSKIFGMENKTQPLPNRALDRLGQRWSAFKQAVAKADMHHGRQGMRYAERAERIKELVTGLAALAPPRAQHVPLDAQHASMDDLLNDIRAARAAVVPPRRQHDPKFRYAINRESNQAIAFLREFAGQWEGPDTRYLQQYFPNLRHAAQTAAQMVAVFDATHWLEQTFTRESLQKSADYAAASRTINHRMQVLRETLPPVGQLDAVAKSYLPKDDCDRYHKAMVDVQYNLNTMASRVWPDRGDPAANLQHGINALRYEACAAAHRAFRQIGAAYRADRALIQKDPALQDARDPIRQPLPMLDRVYHARWALLADAIGDVVKSNRPLLERQGMLTPQTKAEAVRARRDDPGEAQGRLF